MTERWILTAISGLAAVLALTSRAGATGGTETNCSSTSFNVAAPTSLEKFKVNVGTAVGLADSVDEAIQSIVLGASQWNEQASAGHFRYIDTTTDTDILLCPDNSLVYYDTTTCATSAARTFSRCTDGSGNATHVLIVIYKFADRTVPADGDCSDPEDVNTFVNGAATAGRDLTALVAHEFGHALGIGEIENGGGYTGTWYGTMRGNLTHRARQRNLYHWDLLCAEDRNGIRGVTGYNQTHTDTGGFLGEGTMTSSGAVAHASSGRTWGSGSSWWASAVHDRTGASYAKDPMPLATWNDVSGPSKFNAAFIAAVFREPTTLYVDRVIYPYWSTGSYNQTDEHDLLQYRSFDWFATTETVEVMNHCTTMTADLACSTTDTEDIQTARVPAVAWFHGIQRTAVAWQNHDNTGDGSNAEAFELYVSIGSVDNNTLVQPSKTGIRSSVGPGLACSEGFSGSWDCVLAYVRADDPTNTVRARRIDATWSAAQFRYVLTYDTPYQLASGARTANSIAAWYNADNSTFYVAYRSSDKNQKIQALRGLS